MIPPEFHAWIVLATTCAVFCTLIITRRIPLDLLFMTGLMLVTICGIITPKQAFSGFANPAVLTIGALLALTAGLRTCGVIDWLGRIILGGAKTTNSALRRLGGTLLITSPFLLNTALVSMCVPMVLDWCHRNRVSPSKLLIPVSYFSILGGVCTLIGTSTTLVVQAQLSQARQSDPSIELLSFFELGTIGLPCAIIGTIFIVLFAERLLPSRKEIKDQLDEDRREYLIEMTVEEKCALVGKSFEEAGLRHLPGLFLVEIDRDQEIITPALPDDIIRAGDRLVFAGVVETISDLEKIPGLTPSSRLKYEFQTKDGFGQRHLTEVVLSRSSPLIGRTIRTADFRKMYSAVVIAIHRHGQRLHGKLGDIPLESGDTLLIQTRTPFAESYRNNSDFILVSPVDEVETRLHDKAWLAAFIVVGMIVWLVVGSLLNGGETWANPPVAAFTAIVCMVVFRCIQLSDARNSIDIQMLMTIAFALGMGEAMSSSGAALMLANSAKSFTDQPFLLVIVVYLVTMLLTEMISNTAVAAIMIPIGISMASTTGIDSRPIILAVTLASSLSFITPVGYQTNLLVMGPGGYRPIDYFRCGFPLSILVATTALLTLKITFHL